MFLTEVECQGYEDSLINCFHKFGDNICDHDEDVYLTCGECEITTLKKLCMDVVYKIL